MRRIKEISVIAASLCFIAAVVWFCQQGHRPIEIKRVYTADPNYVQNIFEIQQRLKDQGFYAGRVDGIWGAETDKAYCDWCAVREFKE
jgi:hypothetical protein